MNSAVLGVDGCKGGWIGALVEKATVSWLLFTVEETDRIFSSADRVGIDIPIGLPARGERRRCDELARDFLGPARSAVFFAPPRETLELADLRHEEALRELTERGLPLMSAQAWGIVQRIKAVDAAIDPVAQNHVIESHPEVSFRHLCLQPGQRASDVRLASKKVAVGAGQRLAALQAWLPDIVDALAQIPADPRVTVALDDALDAVACAWSTDRWSDGRGSSFPEDDVRDARGLRMSIVA